MGEVMQGKDRILLVRRLDEADKESNETLISN